MHRARLLGKVILLLIPMQLMANMANPIIEGTFGHRPFVSEHARVLHENLNIQINEDFTKALFTVEYQIESDTVGTQIPFLFYASEYLEDFQVTLDGEALEVLPVPESLMPAKGNEFDSFADLFEYGDYCDCGRVDLMESSSRGFTVTTNNMLFFRATLTPGPHTIRATYTATRWTDREGWVNEHSFRYALSPAQYWRSFGTLQLTVSAPDFSGPLTSNLGDPHQGSFDSVAQWQFDSLPIEVLEIINNPKISTTAQMAIWVGPGGLSLVVTLLFLLLLIFSMVKHRSRFPQLRFSPIPLLGTILITGVWVSAGIASYDMISYLIGEEAGMTGYGSLLFILASPIVFLALWLLTWLFDRWLKRVKFKAPPEA